MPSRVLSLVIIFIQCVPQAAHRGRSTRPPAPKPANNSVFHQQHAITLTLTLIIAYILQELFQPEVLGPEISFVPILGV